jgi:hypothetical protein
MICSSDALEDRFSHLCRDISPTTNLCATDPSLSLARPGATQTHPANRPGITPPHISSSPHRTPHNSTTPTTQSHDHHTALRQKPAVTSLQMGKADSYTRNFGYPCSDGRGLLEKQSGSAKQVCEVAKQGRERERTTQREKERARETAGAKERAS